MIDEDRSEVVIVKIPEIGGGEQKKALLNLSYC